MTSKNKMNFTLVEMLVAFAILALLLSILQPSYRKMMEHSASVQCSYNLKQIGLGVHLYTVDYEYFPPSYSHGSVIWAPLVRAYTNNQEVFYCPNDSPEAKWETDFLDKEVEFWGYVPNEQRIRSSSSSSTPFSYGINNDGTRNWRPSLGTGDPWNMSHISRVVKPSEFLIIGDSLSEGTWDGFIDIGVPGEELEPRHFNGASLLFSDIHVDFYDDISMFLSQSGQLPPPHLKKLWNIDNEPH